MGRPRKNASDPVATTADRLIEVSIDLFSRRGFKGTSIRDIARETGLTTSAIYHNFGTKGGLLAAIEERTLEPMMKKLRKAYAVELPAIDRLALLMKTHLTYIGNHRKESRIFFFNEETLPTSRKDLSKKRQREVYFMYRSEIERILTRSDGNRNSSIATFCTIGAMMWFLTWYRPEGTVSMADAIDEIVQFVLHGIFWESSPDKYRSAS